MSATASELSTMIVQPQRGSGPTPDKDSLSPLDRPTAEPQGRADMPGSSSFGQEVPSASASFIAMQQVSPIQAVEAIELRPAIFEAVQKWQGYVTGIDEREGIFYAHLTTTLGEGDEQEAEIFLTAVDPADTDLLRVGAVFYWTIGYLKDRRGTRKDQILRFRRLPVVSRQQLDAAREATNRQRQLLNLPDIESLLAAHSNESAQGKALIAWRDE